MDAPVLTQPTDATLQDVRTSPYAADGGVSLDGLLLLMGAGAVAGAATGIAFGILGQWLYAIILFPLVMGLIVASAQKSVIRWAKIRNPLASGIAGLIAGLAAVTSMHFVDYQVFMQEMGELDATAEAMYELARESGATEDEIALAKLDYENDPEILAVRQVDSFPAYVDWAAKQGVELSSTRSSGAASKPLNLGYAGTYVYWLVDALLIAGVAAFLTREQAAEPFCVACDRWKDEVELGRLAVNPKHAELAVKTGQLSQLTRLSYGASHLSAVSAHVCCQCKSPGDIVLQISNITYNNGQEVKANFGRHVCDESAIEQLGKLFAEPSEPAADLSADHLSADGLPAGGYKADEPAAPIQDGYALIGAGGR